jgi:hypothetical protein
MREVIVPHAFVPLLAVVLGRLRGQPLISR